jgi:hypothetical protein
VDGQSGSVSAAISWLVPKPHTPMQWAAQAEQEYFWHVRNTLRDLTRRSAVQVKFHRIERSALEAAIARGDRRLGAVIENAWRAGARFDGWDEHFRFDIWQAAFAQAGLDMDSFGRRERSPVELLPWDHVAGHRSRESLRQAWEDYCAVMAV